MGEFVRFGSTNWYGLSYEELVNHLAPRFMVQSDRVQILPTNVVFNLVCGIGTTPPEFLATRKFDYTTIEPISVVRGRGLRRIGGMMAPLENHDCIRSLKEAFPGEWVLTKSKYEKLLADTTSLSGRLKRACCFLMACREHGFPLLLKEFESVFGIKTRRLLKATHMNSKELRPFGPEYFTQRVVRLAALPTEVEDMALRTLSQCTAGGLSPTVSAGAAVHLAACRFGIGISMNDIAKMLRVSPAAVRNRERELEHTVRFDGEM